MSKTIRTSSLPSHEDNNDQGDCQIEDSALGKNESKCANDNKVGLQLSTKNLHNLTDYVLTQYGIFAGKSIFIERGIKLVQYTFWLVSKLTKKHKNKELSSSFRKVYSDLSMMRYVLRFYGFPPALQAVTQPGCWAGAPPGRRTQWKDKRIIKLAEIMAWSMFFYHPLEHVAYANWSMPKLLHKIDGNRMSAWSCRFWLVYIIADWASSFLKNCELQKYRTLLLSKDSASELEISQIEKSIKMNKLQMVRNLLFAPPCLTWSLNKWATEPLLQENIVNGMSWVEAVVCIYQSLLCLKET